MMKIIIEDSSGNMKVIVNNKGNTISEVINELKRMAEFEELRNKQADIMSKVVVKGLNQLIDYIKSEEKGA